MANATYRDGYWRGKSSDTWPTQGVENGAFGIAIDGGIKCFDAENGVWMDWSASGNGGSTESDGGGEK